MNIYILTFYILRESKIQIHSKYNIFQEREIHLKYLLPGRELFNEKTESRHFHLTKSDTSNIFTKF